MIEETIKTTVVVLGAGPAGYSAAFRCADLGLKTTLVERYAQLGGVCLNVGCIPSKTLLHVAKIIQETKTMSNFGVSFAPPQIDIGQIASWKKQVIHRLTSGLASMAQLRKVNNITGIGSFNSANLLEVICEHKKINIEFEYAIIAAGSRPIQLPFIPYQDLRIWDSTAALQLRYIPKKLLIIGGGVIGLELATVYHALGSQIDILERSERLIPALDDDIACLFSQQISKKFNCLFNSQVTSVVSESEGLHATWMDKQNITQTGCYDAVLVAVGRSPNGHQLKAANAGVYVNDMGFINVDQQQRTNVAHIFAIGDIVGHPMLAHKGVHEGHIAAEVIAGKKHFFEPKAIPAIAYTDPEIAWVGFTEKEAKAKNIPIEVANVPWSASGRALASDCAQGMTKLIFNRQDHRIIGGAIVGSNGGELLGEIALAIEMGCDAEDIALTVHAHPTLYESIGLAAKLYSGSITDLPNPKTKKQPIDEKCLDIVG